ncbi:MAG: 2OG-Fe(II) oxygenase family protein [Woeseiaceae bacterium]
MSIRTVDYQDPEAGAEFVRSLRETGFAVLKNNPVSGQLLDSIYCGWRNFFKSKEKQDFLFDPENRDGTQQGYHPTEVSETAVGHSVKDLKEYFHVVPGCRIPFSLKSDILSYRDAAFELGKELVGWLQDYTPQDVTPRISEPFVEMLSSDASLLRILHYPPLTGNEEAGAERAAAHEDINMMTILPVAEEPGLQVMDSKGNWVDVASVRGELVVNSGDMLKELTAGYYPSTTHRVINPAADSNVENVSRISIPFFLTPRPDVVLSDRYTCDSYLEERLSLLSR